MYVNEFVLSIIVVLALGVTLMIPAVLIWQLIKDIRNKQLW